MSRNMCEIFFSGNHSRRMNHIEWMNRSRTKLFATQIRWTIIYFERFVIVREWFIKNYSIGHSIKSLVNLFDLQLKSFTNDELNSSSLKKFIIRDESFANESIEKMIHSFIQSNRSRIFSIINSSRSRTMNYTYCRKNSLKLKNRSRTIHKK